MQSPPIPNPPSLGEERAPLSAWQQTRVFPLPEKGLWAQSPESGSASPVLLTSPGLHLQKQPSSQ